MDGVEDQVEKRLAQKLFVGLDDDRLHQDLQLDFLFLDVVIQGAGDFAGDGAEIGGGAADFARAGVIDEFVQLGGDAVGFIDDLAGLGGDFGRGALLFGDDLGQAANDVEGIASFVGQAGGGEVQFLEVEVLFAGADKAQLQFGSLGSCCARPRRNRQSRPCPGSR